MAAASILPATSGLKRSSSFMGQVTPQEYSPRSRRWVTRSFCGPTRYAPNSSRSGPAGSTLFSAMNSTVSPA
ncbi:hypothetical protein Q0M94_03285 [Deinococcus radiomollis]|uniref:hypothetical protein n=1 Tax=Deinococcus radiomollis TaxID=468916 RepID=UPI00389261D8